jgi:hypothetical protein
MPRARIRAAHYIPAAAVPLQTIMHLHALGVARALRRNLDNGVGFIPIELNRGLRDIHVLIAEAGFGQMVENALVDRLPVLLRAAATDYGKGRGQ